jgi:hypothetical protein
VRTRTTGTAGALLALLALTACNGDGSPGASPTATTPAAVPPTTAPATSAPPTTPAATWPAGCASPTALPAGATVVSATVSGGKVSPASKVYDVKLKSVVRILVTADVADEVHLHTYDRHADTKPGCPAALDFEAGIPGTVEVELEDAGLRLFQIRAQ